MKNRKLKRNKNNFNLCYGCYNEKIYGYGGCDKKYSNLSRKKKKRLKNFLSKFRNYISIDYCEYSSLSSCTLGSDYKTYKPFLDKMSLFEKFEKEIKYLFRKDEYSWGGNYYAFESLEEGSGISKDFEFNFGWETDDDYYGGSSGVELVDWKREKEDKHGYSWTHDNMCEISSSMFGMSLKDLNITSFKGFLDEMRKD